ncbi:MAG: histidine phosphatase family protein [Mycobacterium sp.]|nr:histidine phosphatase family protein [Mycobacterium sp.]
MRSARIGSCSETAVPEANYRIRVGIRAERVVQRIRAIHGDVLIFSSGHILRVLTARWLGLEPAAGKYVVLSTASLSALS